MKDLSITDLEELSILNFKDRKKLWSIYNDSIANTNLSLIDYMTIRDILNLSGYDDIGLHILLICMFISLSKGSICIKIDEESLKNKTSIFGLKNIEKTIKDILSRIDKYPQLIYSKSTQEELFQDKANEFKPLVLVKNDKTKLLYFQKYYHAEHKLKSKFLELIQVNYIDNIDTDLLKKTTEEILITNPISINELPIKFNEEQVLAMMVPVFYNLSIISGGPGTGKTSIIINLIRIFVRMGIPVEKIKITAPTGRAAQKISDTIMRNLKSIPAINDIDSCVEEITSSTIHRLLKYDPGQNSFYYNSKNKIDADVLIIDEISMVDAVLLSKLLDAVGNETRVVFLGDRNQLPSIEAGAILADLIPDESKISYSEKFINLISEIINESPEIYSNKISHSKNFLENMVVLLHKNFRSEKSIQEISDEINNQNISAIDKIPVIGIDNFDRNSISLVECDIIQWSGLHGLNKNEDKTGAYKIIEKGNDLIDFHALLSSWINHQFINKSINDSKYLDLISEIEAHDLHEIDDIRALDILENIFLYIDQAKILSPLNSGLTGTTGINSYIIKTFHKKFDIQSNGKFFSGLPIMITKNDYHKNLFNGDTGVVLKQRDNQYYAIFFRSGEFISFPLEILNSYVPAFAITVHKSQGSEYSEVLFVIPGSTPEKMVSKEIIYTGITRAKNLIILYSNDDKLKAGVMKKIERESGIIFEY